MRTKVIALLLFAAIAGFSADREFEQIVKAIESHYGVKRTHIPFLGLANFVVKTARPEGVSGFKLAVFENLDGDPDDQAGLDSFMSGLSGRDLHSMVEVHSQAGGESTYIYAGEPSKYTRLLVATFDRHEATVVEVKVNLDTLIKALQDPGHMTDFLGVRHSEP